MVEVGMVRGAFVQRRAKLLVSPSLVTEVLLSGKPGHYFRCADSGIPRTARVAVVRFENPYLAIVFEDDSFVEVAPGDEPVLSPPRFEELVMHGQQAFVCKAQRSADPPQDCNWPHCGCDERATAVLVALEEEGLLKAKP